MSRGSSPQIYAEGLPREGLLEDPLSSVAGEEEAVAALSSKRGKEPQLGNAYILGLIDHGKVEGRYRTIRIVRGQSIEHAGLGHQTIIAEPCSQTVKDG